MPRFPLAGALMLVGSVCCWGSVPVLLRYLTGWVDAWTANGLRYPFSAAFYWPILWRAWRQGKLNGRLALLCATPAALTFGGQVTWALAPYYLPASAIGFLVRFAMIWSVSLAVTLFPDERLLLRYPLFYAGLFMSLGGFVAFMLLPGSTRFEVTGTGILIMFFCSLFFGLYSISIRHHLQGVPPILAFGVVAQFVSVGTVSAMLALGKPSDVANLGAREWLLMIASSLLGIALGHFFLYSAIQRLGAAITTGAQSATPFVTAMLASIFLGESMTRWQWLAGVTIVVGAAILISNQYVIRGARMGSR